MQEEKTWYYTDQFVNPEERINEAFRNVPEGFASVRGAITIRAPYVAVQQDTEENLHSLVKLNVCSCGLAIDRTKDNRLLAVVLTPHHRNHQTLEHEPYPAFRGKVGSRLSYQVEDPRNPVDVKWNLIAAAMESFAVEEQLDFTTDVEVMPVTIREHMFWMMRCYICLTSELVKTAEECNILQEHHLRDHLLTK
ncbi:MAG: hypothetical protein EBZ61_09385 [Micrococcales bacterium]|nr:hypothetical protein [Micrococcales bacterium]